MLGFEPNENLQDIKIEKPCARKGDDMNNLWKILLGHFGSSFLTVEHLITKMSYFLAIKRNDLTYKWDSQTKWF